MWAILLISLGLASCVFVIFLFGLAKAARRADEGEEKLLSIILSQDSDSEDNSIEADVEVSLTMVESDAV